MGILSATKLLLPPSEPYYPHVPGSFADKPGKADPLHLREMDVSALARDYLYDFRLLMKQNVSSLVISSFKQRGSKNYLIAQRLCS